MIIYGAGLLAACFITGQLIGELLGRLLHIDANVGGVGFAMLLLILSTEWLKKHGRLSFLTGQGIGFWSEMYIPVIVAMAATQNVAAAFSGGYVAFLAGIIPTLCMFLLIPAVSRLSNKKAE